MSDLNLTKEQRLILANQYRILSILQDREIYGKISNALIRGHRWIYEHAIEIYDEFSVLDSKHVLDILEMYRNLNDSYNVLKDKSGIDEHDIKFCGFDCLNESKHADFVSALYENEYFSDVLSGECLSAKTPLRAKYDKMLSNWESIGKSKTPLSKDDILKIISN